MSGKNLRSGNHPEHVINDFIQAPANLVDKKTVARPDQEDHGAGRT